jgi:hypothetical protein
MEDALKNDVLNEIIDRGGRILLHDEVEENGKFIVTAVVSGLVFPNSTEQ